MPVLEMDQLKGPCVSATSFRGSQLSGVKKMVPAIPSPVESEDTIQFDPTSRYVTPGYVGGFFSARTQVLSVTLPSLHNDFYIPTRGYRKRTVASSTRFVPTEGRSTPNQQQLSPRDRLRVETEMLEIAKERSRNSMQVVPHRSEQPYLMAGFPVRLQHRSNTLPELSHTKQLTLPAVATPASIFPPQPSLVNDLDHVIMTSSPIPRHGSSASEVFLTQSAQPIIMDEITVRKCPNYRSACSLLGRDTVLELSKKFRNLSQQSDTLPYSLAEELMSHAPDPSQAVQVLDVTKQGFVDIKDYIVISSFGEHYFKEDVPDYSKFGNKLQTLKRSFEELGDVTIPSTIESISKLLIDQSLMELIISLFNCNPKEDLNFLEFLCVIKFWEELENSVLEEEIADEKDVNDLVTSYIGSTDSTFSFEDLVSTSELL